MGETMNFISGRTPRFTGIVVDILATFEELAYEVWYHATPVDEVEFGRDLYARAMGGEFGEIAPREG